MSAPTEARVRAVMLVQRCGWREACAWLGRRGAEAKWARERARRLWRQAAEAAARKNAEF